MGWHHDRPDAPTGQGSGPIGSPSYPGSPSCPGSPSYPGSPSCPGSP
ncbi:MAG: Tat pathway signal protein, partial [Planctomycetaceae bacterium]|nr:Tat pathway signal protein [Planctomycetaceae bacterium]